MKKTKLMLEVEERIGEDLEGFLKKEYDINPLNKISKNIGVSTFTIRYWFKKLGFNPVKLTLDMLNMEKPFESEVDEDGNANCGRSQGFNINDVQKELIDCAKNIVENYEKEFIPVEDDNPCRNCGYKFYCPKWEEK